MRIVFAGTPAFAESVLTALCDSGFAPVAVFTQPDRPRGRGKKLVAGPVKQSALARDIPVFQPARLHSADEQQLLRDTRPDILVVAAYGLLLPQAVLDIPTRDCINVHASLLPRWRGAAPVERAMMAGDETTGVSIMSMDAGLDTGPVYATDCFALNLQAGAAVLEQQLAERGAALLVDVLTAFASDAPPQTTPQPEDGVTYAKKLVAADRLLDWASNAPALMRRIIALADRMPVRCTVAGQGIQVLAAGVAKNVQPRNDNPAHGEIVEANKSGIYVQTANGILQIERVRIDGKSTVLSPAEALNGYGTVFAPGNLVH